MTKLTATKRDIFGKKLAGPRKEGQMPVVIYGAKEENTSLFVETKAFKKALEEAGESTIVTVKTETGEHDILIHEVSYDPITGEPIHADLLTVEKNKPIQVGVELIFEGVSIAVKDLGGALIKVLHEVEVEALPRDLPHDLKVDISSLTTLDSQILVSDIKLPTGVTMITDAEEVVASIAEAGEEVVAEETPVDLSAIEVEKKGKEEEEGEEAK
ncbi:MAG: 50S ribosomal protein L25 [bacterium]